MAAYFPVADLDPTPVEVEVEVKDDAMGSISDRNISGSGVGGWASWALQGYSVVFCVH